MLGRFITFEGGEGTGKTTQLKRLAAWLEARGLEIVPTREPGGTPGAEAIRRLVVEGDAVRWDSMSELLLFAAARQDHLERLILPALARQAWVLCDRYLDSTRVYQGIAGGLGRERVDLLHRDLLGARLPDLTIVLDLPVEQAFQRLDMLGLERRFEQKGRAFHELVRQGFLDLAREAPERMAVVDASRDVETVASDVRDLVARRFALS
jgi:dTMP kinase